MSIEICLINWLAGVHKMMAVGKRVLLSVQDYRAVYTASWSKVVYESTYNNELTIALL